MISKGKNALIIFKNCLNKFFEVMLGGLLKDSIKTVRQKDALCLSEGVVSYAAFFLSRHATRENKSRNATPENFKISRKVYVCENAET